MCIFSPILETTVGNSLANHKQLTDHKVWYHRSSDYIQPGHLPKFLRWTQRYDHFYKQEKANYKSSLHSSLPPKELRDARWVVDHTQPKKIIFQNSNQNNELLQFYVKSLQEELKCFDHLSKYTPSWLKGIPTDLTGLLHQYRIAKKNKITSCSNNIILQHLISTPLLATP